jgi:hypothetical protein
MQHQGLTPGVQGGNDAGLRAQILRIRQQAVQSVPHRLKQEGGHHRDVRQPQGVEVVRQRKDHVVVVTGQQASALEQQPAFRLEVGALWAGPMAAGVVPDARHMPVGARLDMASQGGGPALHDGAGGFADMGG